MSACGLCTGHSGFVDPLIYIIRLGDETQFFNENYLCKVAQNDLLFHIETFITSCQRCYSFASWWCDHNAIVKVIWCSLGQFVICPLWCDWFSVFSDKLLYEHYGGVCVLVWSRTICDLSLTTKWLTIFVGATLRYRRYRFFAENDGCFQRWLYWRVSCDICCCISVVLTTLFWVFDKGTDKAILSNNKFIGEKESAFEEPVLVLALSIHAAIHAPVCNTTIRCLL